MCFLWQKISVFHKNMYDLKRQSFASISRCIFKNFTSCIRMQNKNTCKGKREICIIPLMSERLWHFHNVSAIAAFKSDIPNSNGPFFQSTVQRLPKMALFLAIFMNSKTISKSNMCDESSLINWKNPKFIQTKKYIWYKKINSNF